MTGYDYTILAYALGGGLILGYAAWLGWQSLSLARRRRTGSAKP